MLAKAVVGVPDPDSVAGGLAYEPKWDGFRCIVLRDGDEVDLVSRGSKPLTRYFPEVVRAVLEHLPQRCAIDTEIVVRKGPPGAQRLDWESLSQRIHPADSRVRRLAAETPAELICFDILALGDDDLTVMPFGARRHRPGLVRAVRRCRPGRRGRQGPGRPVPAGQARHVQDQALQDCRGGGHWLPGPQVGKWGRLSSSGSV